MRQVTPDALASRFRVEGETLVEASMVRRTDHTTVAEAHHDGARFILKEHRRRRRFDREVHAYETWVPALEDRAPRLVAVDRDTHSLVQTSLPGRPPRELTPDLLRQAGRLLRRFHDAGPSVVQARLPYVEERVAHQLRACRRLDLPLDPQWLHHQVALTVGLDDVPARPGHGDFLPRNWLVDDADVLRVIDFENARTQSVAVDVARLVVRTGWEDPAVMHWILDGYGRELSPAEWGHTQVEITLHAVGFWVWAVKTGSTRKAQHSRSVVESMVRAAG